MLQLHSRQTYHTYHKAVSGNCVRHVRSFLSSRISSSHEIDRGESENRGGTEIDSFNGTETFLVRGGTLAVYDALTPHWGEGVKVPQIRG